ncbi:hypothetical protein ABZ215_25005 [Amycolatopsis sp. NPDC006131]|uniref:hypothetical protein n=1 Tax=Amycolatopsis sp. NPDC006131 TaxID=3156731 RepID=UPI0033B5AF82
MGGGGKKPPRGSRRNKGTDSSKDTPGDGTKSKDRSSTGGRHSRWPFRRNRDNKERHDQVLDGDLEPTGRRGWRRKPKGKDDTKPADEGNSRDDTREGGRRRKKDRGKTKDKDVHGEDGVQEVTSEGVEAGGEKPRKRWWWRRRKDTAAQGGTVTEAGSDSGNTYDATKAAKDEARREEKDRRRTDKTLKQLGGVDDAGFPSPPVRQINRAPQRVTPTPVDDAGFPSPPPQAPRSTPPRPGNTTTAPNKETPVNIDSYTAQVDKSSPAAARQSLTETAESARVDALKLEEEAEELRRQARLIQEQTALNPAASKAVTSAEDLLRQAAAKEEDAEKRKGLAASMDDRASSIAI